MLSGAAYGQGFSLGSEPYNNEFNGKKPQLGSQPKVLPSQLLVAEVSRIGEMPDVQAKIDFHA
ncbi:MULTISPECIES: hypothetical protein [unclassified Microcoleus]|uniref:hypothetical protein n=1 Tax=unclassified Microcoleus TaxID=2642155 RepID=UPI002FCF746F